MPETKEEAEWRAEFEKDGERQVYDTAMFNDTISYPPPKRLFALRWLRKQDAARDDRDQQMHFYTRWTFWAAIAAVVVGVIGVVMTLGH
jgi:hypothetical protein